MSEQYDDTDVSFEDGLPITPVQPERSLVDFERLIMGMESDHAKILIVRHFGLRGKEAAKMAGFSSEWSLYRREHDFKQQIQRQREHFVG